MDRIAHRIEHDIAQLKDHKTYGTVTKVLGLTVEIAGFDSRLAVGSVCRLKPDPEAPDIYCEVVGFKDDKAMLMPFGALEGVGLGCRAYIEEGKPLIHPGEHWLGRVINGLAQPIDGLGPLQEGEEGIPLRNTAPSPHTRQRMGAQLDLGVRAVNTFVAMSEGQRMGIFSGSGVGKSVLLSMMARFTDADIAVIGLIGERGREVQEFLEDDLGEEGLKRSVVVVATGDEPALMRRQAAYVTLSTAEYFRNQGKRVLCLMDSVTRFAMAQREIGLSVGEPPTSKGYPPTTFGELSRLLERAGPGGPEQGSITGLFAVLVEGDDKNEPVSDAVRGIVDGHIMMERKIAERGRFPAINVLQSISRSAMKTLPKERQAILQKAKAVLSTYEDMEELIRLGAYRKGTDPKVDEAVRLYPELEAFLAQDMFEQSTIDESFAALQTILEGPTEEE